MNTAKGRSLAVASAGLLFALAWQAATVHFNRGGNWSALFCTGAQAAVPPVLHPERTYRFDGTGFDGQFYRYVAHDPLLQRGFARYVDDPRYRYRRILLPGLAYLLAGGDDDGIDIAYGALVLISLGIGVYAVSRLAVAAGRSPAWGLGFLLLPASVITIDRLTVDATLLALCAVALLAWRAPRDGGLATALALATLTRETGFVLWAAAVIASLVAGRRRRAGLAILAVLPTLGWYAYVHARTQALPNPYELMPLSGIVKAFLHPSAYEGKAHLVAVLDQTADRLALAGILVALVLGLRGFRTLRAGRQADAAALTGALFGAIGLLLQRDDHWPHVFDFGRVYSPLLLVLGLDWLRTRAALDLLPLGLLYPRILLQLGTQVVGVAWGLVRARA